MKYGNPVGVRSLRTNCTLYLQTRSFSFKVQQLGSKVDKRKRESLTGNQLDANTRFLVALATSELQF